MKLSARNSKRGASMIVLITTMAFFILLPLSLLGFELGRYYLLCTQLENVAGACALSGTGSVASINNTTTGSMTPTALAGYYNGAATEALYTLQLNSLVGHPLSTTANVQEFDDHSGLQTNAYTPTAPPDGVCYIGITLWDNSTPNNKRFAPWTEVGVAPTKMRVALAYTMHPCFSAPGMMLSLPLETAYATAIGGLPMLDVFLCLDTSASMDDMTTVMLVDRYLKPNGKIDYLFPFATPQSIINAVVTPPIPLNGSGVNVCPPQNLSYIRNPNGNPPYSFDANARCPAPNPSPPAGCPKEAGTQPGYQSPAPIGPTFNNQNNPFTDMVYVSSSLTGNAAKKAAVLAVEASRGNLQNLTVYTSSGLLNNVAATSNAYKTSTADINPQAYQNYWTSAAMNATPVSQAFAAASNFVSTMNVATNACFGLSTFSSNASGPGKYTYPANPTPATNYDYTPEYLIDSTTAAMAHPPWTTGPYLYGGEAPAFNYLSGETSPSTYNGLGYFPLPFVSLNSKASSVQAPPNSYSLITTALQNPSTTIPYNPMTNPNNILTVTGQTDIYDTLNTAIKDLNQYQRQGSQAAIILFTDGIPEANLANNMNDQTDIVNDLCIGSLKPANIPVYAIGLAQNPNIVSQQAALLNAIASNSGKNSNYIAVTSSTNQTALDDAFQTIARSLVLLSGQ